MQYHTSESSSHPNASVADTVAHSTYSVDQLVAQGITGSEFFVELLNIFTSASEARSAHVWQFDSEGNLQPISKAVSRSEDRPGFAEFERNVAQKSLGQSRVTYEFSAPHPNMPEHLKRCCLASPLFDHERCVAVVTMAVYISDPLDIDNKLEIAYAICNRVRQIYVFDHFAQSHQQLARVNKARTVTEAIGKHLDVKPMMHETVNRLQKYLKSDRVSVLFRHGNRCVVKGVSNQAVFDRRSNVIRRLEQLAAQAVKIEEPIWQPSADNELAPNLQKIVNQYFDASNSVSVAVLPVFAEKKRRDDPNNIAETIQSDEQRLECVGAIVLEGLDRQLDQKRINRRWDRIKDPVSASIANVKKHDSVFLMPVWKRLGAFADLYRGHTARKAWIITTILLFLIGSLFVIPADFKLRGDGIIQPVHRQHIFAKTEGTVATIQFADGQSIQRGDTLLEMENPELSAKIADIEGKLREAETQLETYTIQRVTRGFDTEQEERELVRSTASTEARVVGLKKQLALLHKSEAQLHVTSPLDGQVVTWDTHQRLMDRPVKRGDRLVTVAMPSGGWEVELRIPDKRAGYMLQQWQRSQRSKQTMDVSFVLASDASRVFFGTVFEVSPNSEVDDKENENVVRVRIRLTESEFAKINTVKPGTTVIGHVHCGKTSLGYSKLFEFFDWTRRIWFKFIS